MADLNLDAIEARAATATEGPWRSMWDKVEGGDGTVCFVLDDSYFAADAEFIAAAREDVPALVARIRELEALVRATGELASVYHEKYEGADERWVLTDGAYNARTDITEAQAALFEELTSNG